MFEALSGSFLSVRIALPRIWFDSMKLPTKLARISEFMHGESQPSPSRDFVPISILKSPCENASVTSATLFLLEPDTFTLLYSGAAVGAEVKLI